MNGRSSEPRMRSPTCRANVASASGSSTPNSSPRSRATRSAVAEGVAEPHGQLAHDQVPVVVAERVRHLAEAVEGEDQQRERPLRADGLGEGAAEPVLEQHAVRQPRQLVEEPHLAQRLLGQPLLRDVQDEAPHEARLAVGPRQRPPLVAPPQHPPLAVEDAVLRGEAPSRRAGVAELAQHPLPVLRVKPPHPHVRLGEPLPRREARHREQLRAHVGAAAGVVRPRHVGERRDLLDEGAVAILRLGVAAAAGRARRRPSPLALDGGLEPRGVPPAHAVARARAHEADDLVFGEGLRADDDGREAPPRRPSRSRGPAARRSRRPRPR